MRTAELAARTPSTPLPRWAREHTAAIKLMVFAACLVPAMLLAHDALTGALGTNPLNRLLHDTGRSAIYLLLITLAVTPLRQCLVAWCRRVQARDGKRLSDWNWLVRLRRMLGLFAFAYASAHATIYVLLDADAQFAWIVEDLLERPFIAIGAIGLLALAPLAATSTDAMMRRLARRWRTLHRVVYPAAILAVIHYGWSAKVGATAHLPVAIGLALLLGWRLLSSRGLLTRDSRDDGLEVPERDQHTSGNTQQRG